MTENKGITSWKLLTGLKSEASHIIICKCICKSIFHIMHVTQSMPKDSPTYQLLYRTHTHTHTHI